MSCEYTETNGARNDALNMENLKIDHGQFFPPRRTVFKRVGFGRDR